MEKAKFTVKTFDYFNQAEKNKDNSDWFNKNKSQYELHVKNPFTILITDLKKEFQKDFPHIPITPKNISRPMRPLNRAEREGGLIKNFSHISIAEKRSSLFEWNPGIHLQIGTKEVGSYLGLGLYMVSGRQLSLLRSGLIQDFDLVHSILKSKKIKSSWGEIKGEKYKRFPKGFDENDPASLYLWNKQFYLSQDFNQKDIMAKDFSKKVITDIKAALPLLLWIQETVGVYKSAKNY